MFERFLERVSNIRREIQWIEKKGVIEELTKQGRRPSFIPYETGNTEGILVIIPPEGVDVSIDEYDLLHGGAWEFFSPDGVSKGLCSLHEVTTKVGASLKARRDLTLQQLEPA